MRSLRILTAAVLTNLAAASLCWAQQPAAENEIVVTGERLREIARQFVDEVAAAPPAEDRLARWDRRICPGVIGLRDAATAQAIIDRLALRAYQIGLDVAAPGCRADVIVFITPDSDALAARLRDEFELLMNTRFTANATTMGLGAMEDFVATPRPVRWWSVSQTATRDGFIVGEPVGGFVRVAKIPQIRGEATRLRRATRQDIGRVIVIVDAERAHGLATDSLADYVAMVSLSQVDMNADASTYPSILNLFSGGPAAMTEWDLAFLNGLYDATREANNSRQQAREISRSMAEELTPQP